MIYIYKVSFLSMIPILLVFSMIQPLSIKTFGKEIMLESDFFSWWCVWVTCSLGKSPVGGWHPEDLELNFPGESSFFAPRIDVV